MRVGNLVNEFAKMRHLHVLLLSVVLFLVVCGVGLFAGVLSPDFDGASTSSWNALLLGIGSGFPLAAPLLLAVMASRLVDVEHIGGGWLAAATSGITPGELCRAKLLALGLLAAPVTIATSALFVVVGEVAGIGAPWPAGRWLGQTLCLLVVNLAVLALHVVLAARIENQLIGIGLGLIGTVLALISSSLPTAISHLIPWGYYGLSAGAQYVDGELTGSSPDYPGVAGLALVAGLAVSLLTRSFDRQEA